MNNCPICADPMVTFELEGIEIDRCTECRGNWLDEGEIELLAELAGVDPARVTAGLRAVEKGQASERPCPRCKAKLTTVALPGPERPVHLDRCPKGHGIWFDKGEIHDVIATFEEGEGGAVATFLADMLRDEVDKKED